MNNTTLPTLDDREKYILRGILQYAQSNIDDINDVFAYFDEEDEDNEQGRIYIDEVIGANISEEELSKLIERLGLN